MEQGQVDGEPSDQMFWRAWEIKTSVSQGPTSARSGSIKIICPSVSPSIPNLQIDHHQDEKASSDSKFCFLRVAV